MLVERGDQLTVLVGMLSACIVARGQVAMISGPVGSGKTTLLQHFAENAVDGGATLLSATASRAERSMPFGVFGQLFRGAPLPEDAAGRVTRLLDDGAQNAVPHDGDGEAVEQVTAAFLHELSATVLALADETPLLIGIDEVQYADVASLDCLLYLIRRMQRARVMVLLTDGGCLQGLRPFFYTELISQPHYRHLRLHPLSPAGVTRLLQERRAPAEAVNHVARWCQVTGGNPMLLNALITDHAAADRAEGQEPVAGDAFGHAVLSCLHRGEPALSRIALAVAVLDASARPDRVAEILDADVESTGKGIETLHEAGLLDGCEFRHPTARRAVLDASTYEERTTLHERAAGVLHRNGADAGTVAGHAIAAGARAQPWVIPVLHEAVEQALDNDDLRLAFDCLRLAERLSGDREALLRVKIARARVEWRLDPSTVARRVYELVAAARAGELSGPEEVELLNYLAWHGLVDEMTEVVDHLNGSVDEADTDITTSWHLTGKRLSYLYPTLADKVGAGQRISERARGTSSGKLQLQAAGAIGTLANRGFTDTALASAEYFLQQSRLDDSSFGSITTVLTALVFADRTEEATRWCDRLLREAQARRAPTWCAALSAIRSLISLRQGSLVAAESHARAAISAVPPAGWGVLVGVPLASVLYATMAMGQYEHSAAYLHTPVPDAMFQTPFGVLYVHARGRYDLEIGHPQPALADFQACGELALELRHDTPGLAPWRSSTAEALLALDRVDEARAMAQEELTKFGSYSARARGGALRVFAMCHDLRQRQVLLREAAEALQRSGDRLTLAYTLADLGNTQIALNDHRQARMTVRRAHYVAKQCGAEVLRRRLIPEPSNGMTIPAPRSTDDNRITELSSAERRVAALAAQGRTNLQIARTLYVTVSTVEQHLTRAYRKLQVDGRSHLPLKLLHDLSQDSEMSAVE